MALSKYSSKIYPNREFERAARDKGLHVTCMWEIQGPARTSIAWMAGYLVGNGFVIVQTTNNADGTLWNILSAPRFVNQAAMIEDALQRCGGGPTRTIGDTNEH